MKEVLVVAINYACEEETLAYSKNFENFINKDKIMLCIVDNKSSENSTLKHDLSILKCDVEYFKTDDNLGYMNGMLFGVETFKSKYGYIPNWVVVSNTDIEYDDNMFYHRFLSNYYDNDIWCIGPSVVDSRGGYNNPYYKKRLSIRYVNRIINAFSSSFNAKIYSKLSKIKSKLLRKKQIRQQSQYVYANHGCFFILKKDFFEFLGDERFGSFLYCEENFVAEIILKCGKKSFYDSTLEIRHNANLVTGSFNIGVKAKYINQSMSYIRRTFYE